MTKEEIKKELEKLNIKYLEGEFGENFSFIQCETTQEMKKASQMISFMTNPFATARVSRLVMWIFEGDEYKYGQEVF